MSKKRKLKKEMIVQSVRKRLPDIENGEKNNKVHVPT